MRDDYREASREGRWLLPRLGGWLLALIAVGLLVGMVFTIGALGFGWFSGEANLRSFGHVRDTYRLAYDDIEALGGIHDQACTAQDAVATTTDPQVKEQRRTQLIAYKNTYFRVQREYNAYMEDHFRGGVIKPDDLPMPAPVLDLSDCA